MNNNKDKKPNSVFKFGLAFIIAFALIWALQGGAAAGTGNEVSFSQMVAYFENEMVTSVKVNASGRSYEGTLKDGSSFYCSAPSDYDMAVITEMYLVPQSADGGLQVETVKASILAGLLNWIPTILMLIMMIFLYRSIMGGGAGGQGMMNFGKNKAHMVKDGNKVTFKDVAGLDEEKTELAEIVDFLKSPRKYIELGARIPKGVLLVGPPGTGKTYISKAVAGEAGVPFFSISGSDFVEMFVGVGASRVRDLFADAKKNSPCIVFIDEIDAVGRRRGAGIGGGNDEREQTLNQLLVEMDGFSENEGIIVLAATNRPDVLDPAILRPGRFDRQVTIGTPDIKGREAIFEVHSRNKTLGDDIDLKVLARRTPGFTPADIENMMNEAALLTARRNGSAIHMDDIEEAITRVIAGPKKTSHVMSDKERKLTAFHEAGHAVVMRSIPGCDPVHQVTIMPRGMAGGFTMSLPEEDQYYSTKGQMLDEICHLLGGRVSESLTLDDISTGASNDLERATKIAHDMVVKYGMTDAIGPVNYSDADEVFLGRDFTSKQNFSEELAASIDKEVRRILDECYARTADILNTHMDELNRVAEALLELETIDADQFEALYTGSRATEELKEEMAEKAETRRKAEEKEAAEKKKRDAESAKRAEDKIRKQLTDGKRVAMYDRNGKLVILEPGEDPKAALERAEDGDGAAEAPAPGSGEPAALPEGEAAGETGDSDVE